MRILLPSAAVPDYLAARGGNQRPAGFYAPLAFPSSSAAFSCPKVEAAVSHLERRPPFLEPARSRSGQGMSPCRCITPSSSCLRSDGSGGRRMRCEGGRGPWPPDTRGLGTASTSARSEEHTSE